MAETAKKTEVSATKETARDVSQASNDAFFDESLDSGFEGLDQEDIALPRLSILQGLSPQVNKRKDEYIEGAEIGDIVNLGVGKILPNPYKIVVAKYERRYVEWSPRDEKQVCPLDGIPKVFGKGLIADHGTDSNCLDGTVRDDDSGRIWTKEGNEILPTGTYYCIDPDTLGRFFIPMARTQFTASKKIIAKLNDEKVNRGGTVRTAPIFWRVWNFTTRMRSRDNNEWFVFDVNQDVLLKDHPNGVAILGVVKDFQEQLRSEEVKLDMSGVQDEMGGGNMQDVTPDENKAM